jgi:cytochrome c556
VILPMNAKKFLILAALCLGLAACGGVDPNSPLGKRQAIFKDMLRTSEDLGGMLRGRIAFDDDRFAQGAVRLEELSRQPWQHFPQVHEGDADSAARDEVWQRQERFQALARELEAATVQLAGAVKVRPFTAQGVAPLVQKVEDGCEACHQEFRAY